MVGFDKRIKLEFYGAKITSDGGWLLCRGLDDALGLAEVADEVLEDPRTGKNTRHKIAPLLLQSICSRLVGYEDTNDAERLRVVSKDWQVVEIWRGNQVSWALIIGIEVEFQKKNACVDISSILGVESVRKKTDELSVSL